MKAQCRKELKSCVISFRVTQEEKKKIEFFLKMLRSDKSNWFRNHCKEIINTLKID